MLGFIKINIIMQNVEILNVIMLDVEMLSVVLPLEGDTGNPLAILANWVGFKSCTCVA